MKKIAFVLSMFLVLVACSNNDEKKTYPECIKNQINTFLKNYPSPPDTGVKASVKKYSFKGELVYVVDLSPGFADGAAGVINEKCDVICQLGGIDGNKNDCIDFDKATFIETVWTDNRK